jgi:DNA-binding transcriptional LysR family regulator
MPRISDWEGHIGRRFKLRDLHVFFTVVQSGSMAKAAAHLRVSPPAVSQIIADLEHALGVSLFDRSSQGVEPTSYGRALLKGGAAAFDDLKQTIKEIEFLADPTAGEVRIGCPETVAAILPPIIQRLYQRYPGVTVHVSDAVAPTFDLPQIRDRTIDLALVRVARLPSRHQLAEDLNVELLFRDEAVIVTGANSPWARRRKVDLAELAKELWILPPETSLNSVIVKEAFRASGLNPPKISLVTFSVQLRAILLANGPYITVFPRSMMLLHAEHMGLKVLPVKLRGAQEWPVVIVTLKDRALNPVARLFIDHVRAAVKLLAPNDTFRSQEVR